MGQRLNVEIIDGNYSHPKMMGRTVANAYYHWSGYSESAVEILKEAVKAIEKIKEKDPLIRAIKVLEATGASLTEEELEKGKDILNGYVSTSDVISRNDGFIAVTKEGIEETRSWEEGRIEIHLNPYKSEDFVKFSVFWKQDEAEYRREYAEYGDEIEDAPTVDFNFDKIPFDKIDELAELIENNDAVIVPSRVQFILFIK